MFLHEKVAVGYFAYLAIVTLLRRGRARLVVTVTGASAIVAIVVAARLGGFVRVWWPVVSILAGYWACGQTFERPMVGLEQRLERTDERWLWRTGLLDRLGRAPRVALEYLEAAYFGCVLLVPGGLVVLRLGGHGGETSRYWTAVVIAELAAFGTMPWIQTRPPWAIEPPGPLARRGLVMGRLARMLVDHATLRVNTVPSGHAAASLAAALAVFHAMPGAGAFLLAIAASIIVASVAGRYHYAADAVSGVLLALAAWAIALRFG